MRGVHTGSIEGRVLCADMMNAHNTFEQPEVVRPQAFSAARPTPDGLEVVMPKMSVVALDVM